MAEASQCNVLPIVNSFDGKTSLSSAEFVSIFKKYDKNNNGYIDLGEVDEFLEDMLSELKDEFKDTYSLESLRTTILQKFDTNNDAKISMKELSAVLPTEDNFLMHFRDSNKLHIADFMKIWYHYDVDKNGYLESNELKGFLRDLLERKNESGEKLTVQQIDDYADVILDLFDKNKDGKIEIAELSKILPVEENFLARFKSDLTKDDFEQVFSHYDHDGNGFIEGTELMGLIRDLLENKHREPTTTDLEQYRTCIMDISDTDKDGKLSKSELELLLLGRLK